MLCLHMDGEAVKVWMYNGSDVHVSAIEVRHNGKWNTKESRCSVETSGANSVSRRLFDAFYSGDYEVAVLEQFDVPLSEESRKGLEAEKVVRRLVEIAGRHWEEATHRALVLSISGIFGRRQRLGHVNGCLWRNEETCQAQWTDNCPVD